MGKVFFPLDEELGLLPGTLAPRQQEHLVHLACFMPFDKVREMMEEMVSVQANQETVRRLTEQIGSWMEAAQIAEIDADSEPELEEKLPLPRCVFSADGAMISLVHKQWVETRTVAIGEPQEKLGTQGEREIHVGKLSYFSRLADASTFINLAEVEIRRRKVREAKEVCAVMDGADWCQLFTERHRPDAVRILDFPHAAEHVTKLLEALEQAGMRFPPHMLDRCLHILKHRGPQPLMHMADRLLSDLAQQKGIQEHLDYLRKREALMQYPQFRSSSWPIGSGMVESANKNVVEARLKGAGMHWERNHVNPMLALRNAVCNDRWREMWQKALGHHRKLQALQRAARVEQRAQALLADGNSSLPDSSSPPRDADASSAPSLPVSAAPPPSPLQASAANLCKKEAHRQRAQERVNHFHQRSRGLGGAVCLCGTPLVTLEGHRPKQYCSNRCRQRAHRERQAKISSLLAQRLKQGAHREQAHKRIHRSHQPFVRVDADTCPCGTPLLRLPGHRTREYCSDRCRQRAYRERQAQEVMK